jgi:hypothetical protein
MQPLAPRLLSANKRPMKGLPMHAHALTFLVGFIVGTVVGDYYLARHR